MCYIGALHCAWKGDDTVLYRLLNIYLKKAKICLKYIYKYAMINVYNWALCKVNKIQLFLLFKCPNEEEM